MKSPALSTPLLLLALLSCGCSTPPKAKALTPQPLAPAPLGSEPPRPLSNARPPFVEPGTYKSYYVGLMTDGPHNRYAHPPSAFIVREADERWSANGSPAVVSAGPTLGYQSSAFHPAPLAGEVQAALAQAAAVVAALSDENTRLKHEVGAANAAALSASARVDRLPPAANPPLTPPVLPEPGPASALTLAPAPPLTDAPRSRLSSSESESVEPTLLSFFPSADNSIEVIADLATQSVSSPRIPFEQVYFPTPAMGLTKFRVSVVGPGPLATAVINRKIYAPGEVISDGFSLLAVDDDGVWLRHSFFRVRIPFQEAVVSVRYPKEL